MKTVAFTFAFIVMAAASCGGTRGSSEPEPEEKDSLFTAEVGTLRGQWNIENVVVNDSVYARPREETPSFTSYIIFDDGSYSIMTGCNHIHGDYSQKGDAIVMHDMVSTELSCENMRVEELLREVLPLVRTVVFVNDSVMRLDSDTSGYVVLSRLRNPVK